MRKISKTILTDLYLWPQTQAVHDGDVLSMTTVLSVMKDDTTVHQSQYQISGFVYHRHHSAEQYRFTDTTAPITSNRSIVGPISSKHLQANHFNDHLAQ